MRYKLIISDFDDTLLRSDNTVSKRTVDAIRDYTAAGGVFTISSGRMCSSLLDRLPELGLDKISIPLMGLQGSVVMDNLTGKKLFEKHVPNDVALKLANECALQDVYYQVYVDDKLYISKEDEFSRMYCRVSNVPAYEAGDLKEFIRRTDKPCQKLLAIAEPAHADRLVEQLSARYPSVLFHTSHPAFVEMVNAEAGKGNAARFVAARLGIGMDEVMGIGDGLNDLSLIRAAGMGVAVKNARPALKAAADYVSEYTNDEDAVARLIEQYG